MYYKESRNMWFTTAIDNTGKKHVISGKTKAILEKKLIEFNSVAERGRKFEHYADCWLSSHQAKIEETTAQAYKPHVERAKQFFAGRYIKEITPDEIQAFVEYLVDRDFAKDTVRRGLVVVNKIFKWAIIQPGSEIRVNPCTSVELPRGLKQEQRDPPNEKQLDIVSKADPGTPIGLLAHFLWYTGLRPGELLALKWEDIDREAKTITISKAATYASNNAVVKDRTKTKAGMRVVPLLDVLDSILPEGKTGYVFGGSKPYDKNQFYRDWTKWCASIGLAKTIVDEHKGPNGHIYKKTTYKPLITPYQFRHEYASMLEDEGVSEFDAQHVMGHSSIVITKDKYTKFRQCKNKTSVSEKLNARFGASALERHQ